jgi:hypothetical protein
MNNIADTSLEDTPARESQNQQIAGRRTQDHPRAPRTADRRGDQPLLQWTINRVTPRRGELLQKGLIYDANAGRRIPQLTHTRKRFRSSHPHSLRSQRPKQINRHYSSHADQELHLHQ